MGVFPFRAGHRALILEYGHIFETAILLQIRDALRVNREYSFNFLVTHLRKALTVHRSFHQNFVGANQTHAVVNTFRFTPQFCLNPIQRIEVRHHAHLPRPVTGTRKQRVLFRFMTGAQRTPLGHRCVFRVANHHPASSYGILTKFHQLFL
jgi:hypothetical protein